MFDERVLRHDLMKEEDLLNERIRQHVLDGFMRAVKEGTVEEFQEGSIRELAELTKFGGRAHGLKEEALRRRLHGRPSHLGEDSSGCIPFKACEYIIVCDVLGLDLSPWSDERGEARGGGIEVVEF